MSEAALKDLVRRACVGILYFSGHQGPCVSSYADEDSGEEGLRWLQRELGGSVFISGEGERYPWLPSVWTVHREEAIAIMQDLLPLLIASKNKTAIAKAWYAREALIMLGRMRRRRA